MFHLVERFVSTPQIPSDYTLLKSNNKDLNEVMNHIHNNDLGGLIELGNINTSTNKWIFTNKKVSIEIEFIDHNFRSLIIIVNNQTIRIDSMKHFLVNITKNTGNPYIKDTKTFLFDQFNRKLLKAYDTTNNQELNIDDILNECLLYIS